MVFAAAAPGMAATILVAGDCTLENAIYAAILDDGDFGCPAGNGPDSIVLTDDVVLTAMLPDLFGQVTIEGGGFSIERAEGASDFGLFRIGPGAQVTMREITLRNGRRLEGGGIYNEGTLHVEQSTFSANMAYPAGAGAAIYNDGVLTMDSCAVTQNVGVAILNDGALTMTSCVLSDNDGSAINNGTNASSLHLTDTSLANNTLGITDAGSGEFAMDRCTVSGHSNTEHPAGAAGIRLGPRGTITNTTFSGNAGGSGGALVVDGGVPFEIGVTVASCTFVGNSSANGSYGASIHGFGFQEIAIANNIFASTTDDCQFPGGYLVDQGGNFEDEYTCNFPFSNPLIVAGVDYDPNLADNGGPTLTHALPSTSVAIDAGPGACSVVTDQRNIIREDGACDSGSLEVVPPGPVPSGLFGTGIQLRHRTPGANDHIITVTWDVSECPSPGYDLARGRLDQLPDLIGSVISCGSVGTEGERDINTVNPPGVDLWFLVVGTDGINVEGSWGLSSGGERITEASGECGSTLDLSRTCQIP
jgi:hypothetical protein